MKRILVANRGDIAMRIVKSCQRLGIETVLAVSEADVSSGPARLADQTVCIGPSRATESYLRREIIVAAASHLGCDAVHPGYGFLAEDPKFSELCAQAGLVFIGPSPAMLRLFGDKVSARDAAMAANVPVGSGSPPVGTLEAAVDQAAEIGYPIMLKATKGGGGKGMRIFRDEAELRVGYPLARAEASAAFADSSVFLERWVDRARHVEVQVAGCPSGDVIHLGDRDCTVQRSHQKLVEEAPAPELPPALQAAVRQAAVDLCRHVGYDNVGTVEFLIDVESGDFYFLEVNPRIQVEHGVTELVTGIDVVALQIHIAATGLLDRTQADISIEGCAIECRVNAEQPRLGFRGSPGRITQWEMPCAEWLRIDTHCFAGYFVPPFYDSLLAKVIVRGKDRPQALERMLSTLAEINIAGIDTTLEMSEWIVRTEDFRRMSVSTRWLEQHLLDGAWIH